MNEWSTTCAAVLTSSVAVEADKAQCRELMRASNSDVGWPGAFALAAFFIAVAYGIPRVVREL